jgi:hypothetical protein
MPANERELFDHLRSHAGTRFEIDLLAFALLTLDKFEWVEECEKRNAVPTQAEMDGWISQITTGRVQQARERAAQFFDESARLYLADEFEEARKKAIDEAIVSSVQSAVTTIKSAGNFWKQAGLAMVTAVLAPVIIGAIIVAAGAYDHFMVTPTKFSDALGGDKVAPQPTSDAGPQPSFGNQHK